MTTASKLVCTALLLFTLSLAKMGDAFIVVLICMGAYLVFALASVWRRVTMLTMPTTGGTSRAAARNQLSATGWPRSSQPVTTYALEYRIPARSQPTAT